MHHYSAFFDMKQSVYSRRNNKEKQKIAACCGVQAEPYAPPLGHRGVRLKKVCERHSSRFGPRPAVEELPNTEERLGKMQLERLIQSRRCGRY